MHQPVPARHISERGMKGDAQQHEQRARGIEMMEPVFRGGDGGQLGFLGNKHAFRSVPHSAIAFRSV